MCNHKSPDKRKAETDVMTEKRFEDATLLALKMEKETMNQGMQEIQLLKLEQARKMILPQSLRVHVALPTP